MSHINKKITEIIREKAEEALLKGEVSAFLGFAPGSLPMTTRPYVARSADDAKNLMWNSFCVINLANYLPGITKDLKEDEKVGVLATGCWSRNMVVQIQENQIKREKVVIFGVGSRGMVSRKKVAERIHGKEILEVEELEHSLIVSGKGFREEISRWEVVRDNCHTCRHPNPVMFDYMIGEPFPERRVPEPYYQIQEIEEMKADDRWAWFQKEIDACIRCYACRNVCPLCFCPTCFVDDSRPQWVGKSLDKTDTSLFHILRAFHCAGRCTDCGSCESACPMGIRVRLLTKKLEKDVVELYGVEAGMSLDNPPALASYSPDDPQDFIITEKKMGK